MITSIRVKNIAEGLQCLKKYIRKREEKGKSTIIFAEDRLTLLVERAICEEFGGSMLTDVTTFSRYIKRKNGTVISKQASVVKTGEIMLSLKNSLSCFNKDYSAKSAAKSVYETIAQFSACSITPEVLKNAKFDDRVLSVKIADMAVIYEKYLEFLSSNGYADENSMLSLFPSAVYSDKEIKREGVVFFAFASFTAQAKEGVRAIMDTASDVAGIFESGDDEFYTREGENEFLSVAAEFGDSKNLVFRSSYDELRKKLSSSLFDPETFKRPSISTDRVKVFECSSVQNEAVLAASLIKKHISEGLRFKDITLFVPDTKLYLPEIRKTFSEYKISYFADEKKSLLAHPVARFVLSVFKAVDEGLSASSVDELLSSVFFDGFGEYRNYLAKFASYRGGVKAAVKGTEVLEKYGYDGEYISSCREKTLAVLKEVKNRDSGLGYCASVRNILSLVNADGVSENMIESCKDVALKGYLSQIGGVTDKILKEITAVSGDGTFTAGEFYEILSGGFSSAEISLVPLKADAVFVGDINSSKVNDSKIVIALGLTDDVPLVSSDVALISDGEIIKLKGENIDVAPLISEVNLRSRERVALNILSFTDKLYLSYPVISGGDEKGGSEIISYVLRALSDENGEKMHAERNYSLFPFSCSESVPAEKQLYIERSLLKSGRKKDFKEYSALAALAEEEGIAADEESYEKENISRGDIFFKGKDGVEERFFSPTLIENFNSCPYKNFMERGLGLKEREEGIIKVSDSGNFIHEMLKIVGTGIKGGKVNDIPSCRAKSKEAGEEILSRPEYKSLKDSASDRYYADKLVSDGVKICEGMFAQLDGGNFEVSELERYCRISELGVHGRVDRVDVSDDGIRIIDYKTGTADSTASSYYVGTKLQLQLYMLSELKNAKNGGKKPVGLFYFPARVDFKTSDDEPPFALTGFVSESAAKESEGILGRCSKVPDDGFEKFLSYAEIMVESSKKKMREGFIRPAPYGKVCGYCKFGGMCGFDGEGRKPDYSRITAADIINIVSEEEK